MSVRATNRDLRSTRQSIAYRSIEIEGLEIFYREAGSVDAPTVLLLHGFPSSSRMWEPLLPLLADRYHLIAPDYPGFGHSSAPPTSDFTYTFDRLAQIMDTFVTKLGLAKYVLFVQDYGGPVGFRLALAHPERVRSIVVQNAVSHEQGLSSLWDARRRYWADPAGELDNLKANFTSLEATRLRHVGTSPHPERYDPDSWTDEHAFLSRPGQADIQAKLFLDYRSNVASYPRWQKWLREVQPPMLVVWGKYDPSFTVAGATAYVDDVPDAEVHLLEAGHFALDEATDKVAELVRRFLANC
ncbi:alpha/beta hydrolase [Bradyrhizobium sp. IC3069]|uniref:Pimeloyl-ACP methyl ester carboxylesterase n=1 Tax=Bradyrhizobium yuanmingense TaxID=108015 RepID=A0A1C3VTW2_9BRAD|nr:MULTISPECIES: alpha/beta hydrolase [Bradyrhizobium]MCA1381010.1 alpha/beta hydrolase [Bradyrhizobium sp. BRP05]MCA1360380.1 alpha/beta hydrolase [Bradyrhizobium sp. IC4059]MCA1388903.1 alpha/beta hydrolase [Bradyrhizobium sp. IC3123]MCA1418869.1 alpha/beta hydrolase [Bradyrhizobium sp. BRP23]MCA1432725.1 alpha/beta hydrolase [Bradyrhizobium sp. BRP20]